MFPPGFLGTRADVLIDIVTLSFVVILPFLNWIIYVHTIFAVLASLSWVLLIAVSLIKFASPPGPNSFSATHRIWGRIGMVAMLGAAVTAPPLYYFGFVS